MGISMQEDFTYYRIFGEKPEYLCSVKYESWNDKEVYGLHQETNEA